MPEPEIAHGVDDSRGSRHHQENDDQACIFARGFVHTDRDRALGIRMAAAVIA